MSGRSLRVLYIGGTGIISAACVRRGVEEGMTVSVLNRGRSAGRRPLPEGVETLAGDVRDEDSVRAALGDRDFDAVVDFLSFTPDDARRAVRLFAGRTGHHVHISTAAMYHKPVIHLPIRESTPRHNPYSQYARDKIATEDALLRAYAEDAFPLTIVRPSHTYDEAQPPIPGDWTVVDRIRRGAEIVVPGDGTSLWTLTHASDFAVGLTGLLGNPRVLGETFHITSDDVYTWDQIYELIGRAAGVTPRLVHIPSEFLPLAAPDWGGTEMILGDLRFSVLLDNTKIRAAVPDFVPRTPFHRAADDLLRWRAAHPAETAPDPAVDAVMDRLVAGYHAARDAFAALAPRHE